MYIISGSSGQVGTILCQTLENKGINYHTISLRDTFEHSIGSTEDNKNCVYVNCAFSSGGFTSFKDKGSKIFNENVQIIDKAVRFCKERLSTQFENLTIINICSSALLGRAYTEYSDYKNFYALAKAYSCAKFYELSIEQENIIVANIYVPNLFSEFEKTTSTHFVNQMAHRVVTAINEKKDQVNFIGNAYDSRELVYAPYFSEELINYIENLIKRKSYSRNTDVIFSSGDVYYIEEVAHSLLKATGKELEISFDSTDLLEKINTCFELSPDNFEQIEVKSTKYENAEHGNLEIDNKILIKLLDKVNLQ